MDTTSPGGFPAFRDAIEAITADLGGSKGVRVAIGMMLREPLRDVTAARLNVQYVHDVPYPIEWTYASDADFDAAIRNARATCFRLRNEHEPIRSAPWKGARLVQRGSAVYLEGQSHGLLVATAGDQRPGRQDRYGVADGITVGVFLADGGKYALWAKDHGPSSATVTRIQVKSEAAADKALVKMVQTFFRVSFDNLQPTDA